jgi:adenine-specific DNA-methyltransferase
VSGARTAIDELVARVQRRAADLDADPRDALERVLEALDVAPGDPAWADGRDVVGEAYEALVPTASRRTLGQFFTPLWAARPMAEWLLAEPVDLLLDPGCGSGSLLIGAAHARGDRPTRLLGLDVDPLALRMASVTRHVRSIEALDLRHANFLLDELPERPQAIICNPPYTRHQAVAADLKAAIHKGLATRLGREFSQLASMHVLFLLRALEVAADDARIAFLTPAHWLDMNYARKVKALLLERAHVEAIVTFPVEDRLFDHAVTTAGVTLIRKGVRGDRPTRVVRLSSSHAGEAELRAAITATVPHRPVVLRSQDKWSRSQTDAVPQGVTLGDLAHVRRGIATGCNAFFVLSEARRRELAIDVDDVIPCIASPRHFAGAELRLVDLDAMDDTVPRWLLRVAKAPRSGALARYLRRGRSEFGVLERTLTRQRVKAGRKWFEVELDVTAPILFRYLNTSSARFVRNRALAAPLNNWLVIQPKTGVDADALFCLLQQVSDSSALREDSRHYGKGLWKLEPLELRELPLPAAARRLKP